MVGCYFLFLLYRVYNLFFLGTWAWYRLQNKPYLMNFLSGQDLRIFGQWSFFSQYEKKKYINKIRSFI